MGSRTGKDVGADAERGSPGRLSRRRVLETALELVDRQGLESLTMRRLAAELGVDAMAIYRYASSKEALLDGLVDLVMDRLGDPPGTSDWRRQLHEIATSFRSLALAHPHVFELIATRPLRVPIARRPPAMLRRTEDLLDVLCRAGFDDESAVTAYHRFLSFLLGSLLVELRDNEDDVGEVSPELRLGLHRLPRHEFPRLCALAGRVAEHDGAADFALALDAVLDGLEGLQAPERRATGA